VKTQTSAEQSITLNHGVIVVDENQPAYVQHAVGELAEYLKEITGSEIGIKSAPVPDAPLQIVVGGPSVQKVAPDLWQAHAETLGQEGFLIRALPHGRGTALIVMGATPQGTNYGVIDLMKRIQVREQSAFVCTTNDVIIRPSFPVRGMHLNGWAFKYPHTFRCWKEADWRHYVDLLAYQGVNLFFIWPFMEIMPVPLSAEDEEYLHEVRRVVDYAQRQRGMEVWVFQSANRVAVSDCGVRDPRLRPYWVLQAQGDFPAAGQVDMDPANPQQFEAIMQSREALYRIVNNADGYCTIDNDPGGMEQSPVGDFMKIFTASRALLDRLAVLGQRTKLIQWLWTGWGVGGRWWAADCNPQERHDFMREMIRAMKELREPWWIVAGRREYLPACAAEGVLAKTVYLPYSIIEDEPSRPRTQHNFPNMRDHLDALSSYPGIAGVMGNVQTPLLQFPHVYSFLSSAWDFESRRRSPREVLLELARHLYPDQAEVLADCWIALASCGRAHMDELVGCLERLTAEDCLVRPGMFARKLFPHRLQITRDLLWQLKGRLAFEALRAGATSDARPETCATLIEAWLDAELAWDQQHGWSVYWRTLGRAWDLMPVADAGFPQILANVKKVLGGTADEPTLDLFLEPICQRLMRKYDAWVVAQCAIAPLKKAILEVK